VVEIDPNHSLFEHFLEWKKWDRIQMGGQAKYIHDSGLERRMISEGRSTKGLPKPSSLGERTMQATIRNDARKALDEQINRYVAENPGVTREEVETALIAMLEIEDAK
jgi:hypothetical protein